MSLIFKENTVKNNSNSPTLTLKNPNTANLKLLKTKLQEESEGIEQPTSKKQKFEFFLTYRKRLSRLAIVQSIFFYEQFTKFSKANFTQEEKANEAYRTIIYFYKRLFFYSNYGTNKKNKKLEERFVRKIITQYVLNSTLIDNQISKFLNKNWKLKYLNSILRATLRSAVCEALFSPKKQYTLLISEYTNLIATELSNKKEVDFCNAILDNIMKDIKNNICKQK